LWRQEFNLSPRAPVRSCYGSTRLWSSPPRYLPLHAPPTRGAATLPFSLNPFCRATILDQAGAACRHARLVKPRRRCATKLSDLRRLRYWHFHCAQNSATWRVPFARRAVTMDSESAGHALPYLPPLSAHIDGILPPPHRAHRPCRKPKRAWNYGAGHATLCIPAALDDIALPLLPATRCAALQPTRLLQHAYRTHHGTHAPSPLSPGYTLPPATAAQLLPVPGRLRCALTLNAPHLARRYRCHYRSRCRLPRFPLLHTMPLRCYRTCCACPDAPHSLRATTPLAQPTWATPSSPGISIALGTGTWLQHAPRNALVHAARRPAGSGMKGCAT